MDESSPTMAPHIIGQWQESSGGLGEDIAHDTARAAHETAGSESVYNKTLAGGADAGKIDTNSAWENLLEAMESCDKKIIDAWNDELNNLLVFAGLFSAVVTSFTIESYSWLQDDSTDLSLKVLTQISLQLSSLTINAGFINSTAPPVLLSSPGAPSSPTSVALKVNTLWILSLTLSLIAAFYAITVQQWLRRAGLPQHLSVRDSVRLRQLRYDGFYSWRVSPIVSLLPILLQVAVILFLVGLLLLLYSVNSGIALIFTIVSGIPMLFFLIMTLIPLFLTRCPYKSPLIPTLLVVLKWCAFPMVLIICIAAVILLEPLRLVFHQTRVSNTVNAMSDSFNTLFSHMAGFRGRLVVDIDRFWTDRELDRLTSRRHSLDPRAVSWALCSLPRHRIVHVKDCMRDFSQIESIFCVLLAAARSLGTSNIDFWNDSDFVRFSPFCPVNPRMLAAVNRQFTEQHRDSLLEVLPRDWSTGNWMISGKPSPDYRKRVPSILMLLWAIAKHDPRSAFSSSFTKLLMSALEHRLTIERHHGIYPQIPIALLFDCCVSIHQGGYPFEEHEALKALLWAKQELELAAALGASAQVGEDTDKDEYRFKINLLEIVLGSSAVGLLAVSQRPWTVQTNSPLYTHFHAFVDSLAIFVSEKTQDIRYLSQLCYTQPWDTTIVVTPGAVASISKSITKLAHGVSSGFDSPSDRLAAHLMDVCKDHRNPHLRKATMHLGRLTSASPPFTRNTSQAPNPSDQRTCRITEEGAQNILIHTNVGIENIPSEENGSHSRLDSSWHHHRVAIPAGECCPPIDTYSTISI